MMKTTTLKLKFVEELPHEPNEGVIYISMEHSIAVHLCPCGCGSKVFTPFAPRQWKLSFDRKVTITPSIGNYQLPCQSHYYIVSNEIKWIPRHYENDHLNHSKHHKTKKEQHCSRWFHLE